MNNLLFITLLILHLVALAMPMHHTENDQGIGEAKKPEHNLPKINTGKRENVSNGESSSKYVHSPLREGHSPRHGFDSPNSRRSPQLMSPRGKSLHNSPQGSPTRRGAIPGHVFYEETPDAEFSQIHNSKLQRAGSSLSDTLSSDFAEEKHEESVHASHDIGTEIGAVSMDDESKVPLVESPTSAHGETHDQLDSEVEHQQAVGGGVLRMPDGSQIYGNLRVHGRKVHGI